MRDFAYENEPAYEDEPENRKRRNLGIANLENVYCAHVEESCNRKLSVFTQTFRQNQLENFCQREFKCVKFTGQHSMDEENAFDESVENSNDRKRRERRSMTFYKAVQKGWYSLIQYLQSLYSLCL